MMDPPGKQDSLSSSSTGRGSELEEWNFVPIEESFPGQSMHSSCELVHVTRCTSNERSGENVTEPGNLNTLDVSGNEPNSSKSNIDEAAEINDGKDKELKRLIEILQERVRSGSPSHSVSDSDFENITGSEMVDLPEIEHTNGIAAPHFSIIYNHGDHHDDDDADDDLSTGDLRPDDESLPDVDDRVESDILATRHIAEQDHDNNTGEEVVTATPIRQYRHRPNSDLNTMLNAVAFLAVSLAVGIAIGHSFGSAREAGLQQQIQEGQRLRLRAVQDDLLMCLRKQEDIDQTINKLNEIENILVDAEHWRNEYEELLNLKLQNEEAWKSERASLQNLLNELEKSRDNLLRSKSCAHDSEYLSRQETTLKSVHEKLEANLLEKDRQIENLQLQSTNCKVALVGAEKLAEAYRKSNEEKSLGILQAKEQLLQLERELFDMKINGNVQSEEKETQVEQPVCDDKNEDAKQQIEKLKQELTTSQTQLANYMNDMKAYQLNSSLLIEKIQADSLTSETQKLEEIDQLRQELKTAQDQSANYKNDLKLIQLNNSLLLEKFQEMEVNLSRLNDVSSAADNKSTPCVVINICDKLKLNVTSQQVLALYNATKVKYNSVEAFLLAEWRNFTERLFSPVPTSTNMPPVENKTMSTFGKFINVLNSTWSEIEELSKSLAKQSISSTGIQKKMAKKLEKMVKKISKGWRHVKNGFQKPQGTPSRQESVVEETADSAGREFSDTYSEIPETVVDAPDVESPEFFEKSSQGYSETTNEEQKTQQRSWVEERSRKDFRRRLEEVRQNLQRLNSWKLDKIKHYAKEDIYELFDDFKDDYSYLLNEPNLHWVKSWSDCQSSWWKHHFSNEEFKAEDLDACTEHLLPWQHQLTGEKLRGTDSPEDETPWQRSESDWFYKRAEERQFVRDTPDDWYWRKSLAHEKSKISEDF